jgi:murein DD-endopeptidase MepM/ murein hydrolase activator NlpD
MSHRASPLKQGAERPARHHHSVHPVPVRHGTPAQTYTLAHAGRQVRLGPVAFWITVSVLVIMAVWSGATATYFTFRDDLLTRLIGRQAAMQYAYEDRIADLRAQIDRLTSRQLLDQDQVEGRIAQLAHRQATLESRAATLSTMSASAPVGSIRRSAHHGSRSEDAAGKPAASSRHSIPQPLPEQQSMLDFGLFATPAHAEAKQARTIEAKLAALDQSLDRVENRQNATLSAAVARYDGRVKHMRGLLDDIGATTGRQPKIAAPTGIGGPFIPAKLAPDASKFDRLLQRATLARDDAERLAHTLVRLPYRKPLPDDIEVTSGFGVRADPFYHAAGMHTGMDMRGHVGEGVHATAAGKVVIAGWSGGYGNMVEIDHGGGLSTRYGHLSRILVKAGETVKPGQIIGRVGSTGRSTGPHLHYETRIDGAPVNPEKFLEPGERFSEAG